MSIDSERVTASCAKCGITESGVALDKGHPMRGSRWKAPYFPSFAAKLDGDNTQLGCPPIVATCVKCEGAAVIQ